ncbi:MAG: DNA-processing protein DprA [Clostridia bacterium]|nr:DNA-processing protein DprA [Clostridia bacterium]
MIYWIWFATLETLNPIQKKKLLDVYNNPEKIYYEKEEKLKKLNFLTDRNIEEMRQKKDINLLKRYQNYIKNNNIYMLNIVDNEYPEKLRNIYDPPITLFLKGNKELINKTKNIAVIGCRNATAYGLKISEEIAYKLALNDVIVVSGMAKGIDGMAHRGALKSLCASTIAVLGSGVDYPYPTENIEIYKEILKNNGLIISEYIVGTRPKAQNFPKRNRIISALSDGVLVVEAKKKSGTMITVDFALEQGKNVYIIPGNINSVNSEGTNELIKQGAKLVNKVEDILEDF